MATEKDKTIQDAVEEICTLARLSPKAAYGLKFRKILEAIRDAARADAIEECAKAVEYANYTKISRDLHAKHKAANRPEPTADEAIVTTLLCMASLLRSLSRKQEEPR